MYSFLLVSNIICFHSGAEVLEEANKLEKWINEVGVKDNKEINEAFSWVKEYRDRNGLKSPFVRYQKLDEVMKLGTFLF